MSEWPIWIIDIEGIYETNILQDQASGGRDSDHIWVTKLYS
jgi:hypothetical protein